MNQRPEVGATVKTAPYGSLDTVYEGVVTKHADDPVIFWLRVEKVNGESKKPGTYPSPAVAHIQDIVS